MQQLEEEAEPMHIFIEGGGGVNGMDTHVWATPCIALMETITGEVL